MSLHERSNTERPVIVMVPLSYKYEDLVDTMTRVIVSSVMGDQRFLTAYGMLPEDQMDVANAATFIKRAIQANADHMPRVLLFFYDMKKPLDRLLLEAQTRTNGIRHVLGIWWNYRQMDVYKADVVIEAGPTLRGVIRKALSDPTKGLPEDEVKEFVDMLYAGVEKPKARGPILGMSGNPDPSELTEEQKNILAEAAESM